VTNVGGDGAKPAFIITRRAGIIEELRAAGLEIQRIDAILIRNPRRRADPDGLLRHVVYLGEREDKPAEDIRRPRPGG